MTALPRSPTPDAAVTDDGLRVYSGYSMKLAFNAVQSDLNRALAPMGLRLLSFSALVLIVDNPGLSQSQLAQALAIERPNLVQVIDGLETRGLIARSRAAGDRRAYALAATEEGARLCLAARGVVDAHETRMTAAMSEADRQRLIALLRRVEEGGK